MSCLLGEELDDGEKNKKRFEQRKEKEEEEEGEGEGRERIYWKLINWGKNP